MSGLCIRRRAVNCATHTWRRITQTVFVILARKAGWLSPDTVLSGRFYRTAFFVCADVRRELRHQQRKHEANMEASIDTSDRKPVWNKLAPVLEEDIARLCDCDREAFVLRFFENKSMKDIAATRRNATGSTIVIIRGALKAMIWAKLKFSLSISATALLLGAATTFGLAQWSSKLAAAPTNNLTVVPPVTPGPAALILVGLIPSDAPEPVESLAVQTKSNIVARGWAADHVEILSGKVTREQILQKIHSVAGSASGEFWLMLLGQCGKAQGGVPTFQVSGPRLTAPDLKAALDTIPGRQFVFIGTGNAGGFLPPLQDERRIVLSATRVEGEPDQPRFLSAWVKEFAATPKASLAEIAARAADDVSEQYKQANMAQSEHAQLADPATGKILDAPFGVNLATNQPVAEK